MGKIRFNHGPLGDKHNDLFRPGPNMDLNACVGKNGGPAGFDRYARGYFLAGERLLKTLKEDHWDVDLVVYPLVTVYRHGVETALKYLARVTPWLCDSPPNVKNTHKLLDNWNIMRPHLLALDADVDEIKQVERTLKDLVEIDATGEAFRYPAANDGTLLLQTTSIINVEVFGEQMDFIARFFDGCCAWIDHLIECKQDQIAAGREAADEMADYYS